MATRVFVVNACQEIEPHYNPAHVEIGYNNGVQTTKFRLSPESAYLLAEDLLIAANKADALHREACQKG